MLLQEVVGKEPDARIVVCNRKLKNTPESCQYFNFCSSCPHSTRINQDPSYNSADRNSVKSLEALELKDRYIEKDKTVCISFCECKNDTSAIGKSQIVKRQTHAYFIPGGLNEDSNLRSESQQLCAS